MGKCSIYYIDTHPHLCYNKPYTVEMGGDFATMKEDNKIVWDLKLTQMIVGKVVGSYSSIKTPIELVSGYDGEIWQAEGLQVLRMANELQM